MAIDVVSPLSESAHFVDSAMMTLTSVSNQNQLFSFDVKQGASLFDGSVQTRVPVILTFEGVSESDQNAIEKSTLYYYQDPVVGATCLVDRFDCYPT